MDTKYVCELYKVSNLRALANIMSCNREKNTSNIKALTTVFTKQY